jgi:hypothetical protein
MSAVARLKRPDTLILGAVAVVLAGMAVCAWIGLRVNGWILDETVIKQSAVHYTTGLPDTLLHDLNARGTSRGYSLLLAPLFVAFDGLQGVRLAHVANVVFWVTGAMPAFLIARQVIASRALAVSAAVAVVLVPWVGLTSVLFTENLAYPMFLWASWAIMRALWNPTWRSDLLAVVLALAVAGARVQLAVMIVAYWAAIFATLHGRVAGSWLMGLRRLRRHPVAMVALVIAGLALVKLQLGGQLHSKIASVLGGYSEIQDRPIVPTDYVKGMLAESEALALGIGIIPGAIGLDWLRRSLTTGRDPSPVHRIFARASIAIVVLVAGSAMYAQNGFLGAGTEERYFIYCVPLVLIAGFVALDRRSVAVGPTFAWVALLACVVSLLGLPDPASSDSAVLAPVNMGVNLLIGRVLGHLNVGGLSGTDLLFWAIVAVGLAWALAWRLLPRTRIGVTVAIGFALQLAVTGVGLAAIDGRFHEVPGRTGGVGDVSWIDRAVGSVYAIWLNNQSRAGAVSPSVLQRQTLFYNDQVRAVINDEATGLPSVDFPMDALPIVALSSLKPGSLGSQYVVQVSASPFVQLAGRVVALHAVDGLELIAPQPDLRPRWEMTGAAPDGTVAAQTAWRLAPGMAAAVTLRSANGGVAVIASAGRRRVVRVGSEHVVNVSGCGAGRLRALRGGVVVAAVVVMRADAARCTLRD